MERTKVGKSLNVVSIRQIFLHHFASQTFILHTDVTTKKLVMKNLKKYLIIYHLRMN
jgi:hypothetical protein